MPLASLANLQWNGPASLAAVDEAAATELVTPKAYGNVRYGDDAASGSVVAMTRVRSMELVDDASSDATASMRQVSSIRFVNDVGERPSAEAIAQAVWTAGSAALDNAGTMGGLVNDAGAAGDPWNTTLPGAYAAGTAGNIVGNQPTAEQIADALLDMVDAIEAGLTPRQALRLMTSVLGGEVSGAGTPTITFRNAIADDTVRITADVDEAGNRTTITADLD